MKPSRIAAAVLLVVLSAYPALAGKRRAAAPAMPGTADALGLGEMSGAMIAGTVYSLAGTVVTLDTGGAAPIRIEAKDARIVAHDRMPRTVAEIVEGTRITAWVGSAPSPGAPLPAKVIAVESRPDLLIAGVVESVDLQLSTFAVLGITIAVDDSTQFETAFPTFAPMRGLEDLQAGNAVRVDVELTGSKLLAERVLVVNPTAHAPTTFRGVVKSISDTSWVITRKSEGDVTVTVNSETKIAGDPKVGDEVQVVAEKDAAGGYVAQLIVRLGPIDVPDFFFRGWVQSIGPEQWTIGGPPGSMMAPSIVVKITPQTKIYPNPKVEDVVTVKGYREDDGDLVATSISREIW